MAASGSDELGTCRCASVVVLFTLMAYQQESLFGQWQRERLSFDQLEGRIDHVTTPRPGGVRTAFLLHTIVIHSFNLCLDRYFAFFRQTRAPQNDDTVTTPALAS